MNVIKVILHTLVLLVKGSRNKGVSCLAYLFFLLVIVSSCSKEFLNPYDPATPPEEWMPRDFRLDTLGINSLHLHWQQDNRHIDGYVVQKYTNGALKEFLVFRDTIDFIDANVVEANVEATCPEIRYEVLARAGRNRSDAVGMQSPIYMPLSVPAYAGEDVLITDTTTIIQLNAQAATVGEAGRWSIVSGSGGSFANERQHNTSFTGTPCNAYVLRWSKQGCTETFDEVNVSFYPSLTTANAGSDQVFTNSTTQTTLNANAPGLGQTGLWTIVSGEGGTFADASAPNTTFTGQSCTEYVLKWTISGTCDNSDDNVTIKFMKATTAANAGVDQTFNHTSSTINLMANQPGSDEVGFWSIASGSDGSISNPNLANSIFIGEICNTYILRWNIQGLCFTSADDITIFAVTSSANAGTDQAPINTNLVTLAANVPSNGATGMWSIISGLGGSFSNASAYNSQFTGVLNQNYLLRWTVTNCSSATDDVIIVFPEAMSGNGVTDIDGNIYTTTIIGTQEWMGSNLKTTRFADGTGITLYTTDWSASSISPAYGYYNNNFANNVVYGKLYNWYAAVDSRNVCPTGWHVPSKAEWDILFNYLGSNNGVGKLKQTGTTNWLAPNTGATNSVGFNAVPGGFRFTNSQQMNNVAWYLSTTSSENTEFAELEPMHYNAGYRQNTQYFKSMGYSIRCVKN